MTDIMYSNFTSTPEEGKERAPEQNTPQGSDSLAEGTEDIHVAKDLELTLNAITKLLHNLETMTTEINGENEFQVEELTTEINGVNEFRVEELTTEINGMNEFRVVELNLKNAEKSVEEDRRLRHTDSDTETLQELVKLHNAERDKWKSERNKWKLQKDSWKLICNTWKHACKRLEDKACAWEQQLRKRTLESERWTAEFTRLASADAEGRNVAEVRRDLLEQLHVEHQTLDLQRRTGDRVKLSNHQAVTGKLERHPDGMSGKLTQSESDMQKGKHNKTDAEDFVSHKQPVHLILERHRWEAQCAKLRTALSEGILHELLKLHNTERDQWKVERDSYRETMQDLMKVHNAEREKWKVERDTWELTIKTLKDEACDREQQLTILTLESQRRKAVFTRLASAEAEGKNIAEVCRDMLEQHPVDEQILNLERRTGYHQQVSNIEALTETLDGCSDGNSAHLTRSESSEEDGTHSEPKVEDWASQHQVLQLILERQTREAQSEREKLEELCRDLIDEQERSNVELENASKLNALANQTIMEQREEINRLQKTTGVAECIVCMTEFGEGVDQQRAYWKNCNHANICYKCTKTLWTSKNRQCPSCRTPASTMPTPLPAKIYF